MVMVKNVGQSIPTYSMSCFLMPKSLCKEIERMLNGYWWGSTGSNSKGIRWSAWEKMALPKCKGGLGFRDLYGFNLALLGKHVWNFCSKPDSLVTRIFKAKYFSEDSILNAAKGVGSCFVWTGIWEAKERLKNGFRWVLGDGESIRIYKDPWLKGKSDFCVEDSHMNGGRNERVSCYFHPQSKVWDVQKVQHNFHTNDIDLILQTRIPQNMAAKDRIAWTTSTTGLYTVKTGYQYWSFQNSVGTEVTVSRNWNKIWHLNLPHKMRTFIWRFCNNTIPVRKLLRSRGVNTTIICPMCDVDIEHMLHIFFDCKFASDCWRKVGLEYDTQLEESASNWVLQRMENEAPQITEKIATVLWSIWFARNQKIWENKNITPTIAVDIGVRQVQEWQEALKRKVKFGGIKPVEPEGTSAWKPPQKDCLKLNVDASVFSNEEFFSLGMVIRNDKGKYVKWKNMCISDKVSVMEAEARGVQEAILWLEDLRLEGVCIECDSALVVDAVQKQEKYYLEVGHILDFCRQKLRSSLDFALCHVKKQFNHVAHLLARAPCMVDCYNIFESPPSLLLETLYSDYSI